MVIITGSYLTTTPPVLEFFRVRVWIVTTVFRRSPSIVLERNYADTSAAAVISVQVAGIVAVRFCRSATNILRDARF